MSQDPEQASVIDTYYDDAPLSHVLFRFVWPFWLFKDASRGDRYARLAAYRHNRRMRVHLPGYLVKWLLCSVTALAGAAGFGSLSTIAGSTPDIFGLIAAGWSLVFAGSLCVLVLTSYVYLYLGRNDA